jgi:hypothetical protein
VDAGNVPKRRPCLFRIWHNERSDVGLKKQWIAISFRNTRLKESAWWKKENDPHVTNEEDFVFR